MQRKLHGLDDDERRLIGPYLTVDKPSGDEWRGYCAECEDPTTSNSPSASYNFSRYEWHCMKNDCGGTIGKLLNKLQKVEKGADVIDIGTRKPAKQPEKPLPTEEQIDAWMVKLHENPKLLTLMSDRRGLSGVTLAKFRIGYNLTRKRFTIPVYAADSELLNVRMYDPYAKGTTSKMLPYATGYGTQLYNDKSLDENDEIVLCEGEWDCMINEQNGIPTVTHTGGAGAFQMAWVSKFKGKHVFICFDEDEGGIKGATRTARFLRETAAGVYIMSNLKTGKKSGDITDFYLLGNSGDQFVALMDEAREKPFALDESNKPVATTGRKVSIEESQNAEYSGETLELDILIAGKQTPTYMAPKKIHALCDQLKGKVCMTCPMAAYDGARTVETSPDDHKLIKFVGANETSQRAVLRSLVGAACADRVEYNVEAEWNVEELVAVQSLENRTEEIMTPMSRKIFNVGTYKSGVNSTARIVGRQICDPRDAHGIFHAWHLEPTVSDIDKFVLMHEDIDALKVFQTEFGQTPLEKCKEIARDLETNVTQIYGRPQLHIAYDLVWHSVLDFKVFGKRIDKGWLDAIVIGDTRTGKSETASALRNHYQAGTVKSCEGATFAGLVGGAQQGPQGKQWMVTWGVIPLNDRRLVVLDELSGLIAAGGESKGIIEQMSTIRSSGKAQLAKIISEETSARTRLLWISNPADGKRFAEAAGGGMTAIRKLVKNPEDIARFDFMLAIGNGEVPSSSINIMKHAKVEHIYNTDISNKLLMWAWSRKANQVKFVKGAEQEIIKASEDMGNRYVPDPPLVQVENIRMKLARIAVAIAARTFSTNKVADEVWVLPCHIHAAVEFLDWIYGSDVTGYLHRSEEIRNDRATALSNKPVVTDYLKNNLSLLDALRAVMYADSFRPRDFDEYGGGDIDSKSVVNLLRRWKMVRRLDVVGGRMVLEPTMIEILKELRTYD